MSDGVVPPWKVVTQDKVPWLPVDEESVPEQPIAWTAPEVPEPKRQKTKKPGVKVAQPGEPDPQPPVPVREVAVQAQTTPAAIPGPVTSPTEPTLTSMNAGLDDIFSDEESPTAAPVATEPAASGLDDLFAEDTVAPATESVVAPEPRPTPVFGLPTEPTEGPVTAPVDPSLADALVREVSVVDNHDAQVAEERARFEAQLSAQMHLYEIVDQLLSFIAQDAQLQVMVNDFVLTRDVTLDREQRATLQDKVAPRLIDSNISIGNPRDIETVFDLAYDEMIGISVVGDLWRDESVDEILIDAWDKICVERYGRIVETGRRFRSPEHALGVARRLSQLVSDRAVSRTNALVTAQLPRARVQFIWGNVAASGLAVSIRKFRDLLGMDKLLEFASLSEEMRDFLADAVHARATILVSGGTGTGKTTMINALSEFIPDSERVITIEDSYELSLSNRHVVALQAKGRSSSDDTVIITQEDLMVASLRMRPDRIIVGEIREPSAAAVMLQAANTGHDGTMTTLHASSVNVALNNRMVSLLMRSGVGFSDDVARSEVSQAIDLVIQISRRGGRRYVSEIALVDPSYLETGSVRALPLFVGEYRARMLESGETVPEVSYRQVGRIPSTSGLGIKLGDLGDVTRWLI